MVFPARIVGTTGAQWFFAVVTGVFALAAISARTDAETGAALWFVTLLVPFVALAALLPGLRMKYEVGGHVLTVRNAVSTRRYDLRGARASLGSLGGGLRVFGWSGLNGHVGLYTFAALPGGTVEVFASDLRGEVVVLTFPNRAPLVVSPADPAAFAEAVNSG